MKNKRMSLNPVEAYVDKFSHDGRGLARIDGKTTFIQGALPNEHVLFQYTRKKSDYDEGRVCGILQASSSRVEPACPHYQICGGCSLQHMSSEAQIQSKQMVLMDVFARMGHCEPEQWLSPLSSEIWHYRNKARLSVRYVEKKQATLIGFREKQNPRYIAEIDHCAILNQRVSDALPRLKATLDRFEDPKTIAQVEVSAGDAAVALIFRHLSPLSTNDQGLLRQFADETTFQIYLQPGGPETVHLFYPEHQQAQLTYALPDHGLVYAFHPTDFTQVNASMNRLMVNQALSLLALQPEELVLDLFCGLGNFSLPMAQQCRQVIGVEGSQTMVERAAANAALNGLTNCAFFAANLEETSIFSRLKSYAFTSLLLDPPRTGAYAVVKDIHQLNPKKILYVSCNPVTLARDADILVNQHGYRLAQAGVMDMFPHTGHVESMALFYKD